MIIRLADVPATGREYVGEEPPEIVDVGEDMGVRVLGPIAYRLRALRVSGSLIVSGTLSTRAEFHCSRCDEPFEREFEDPQFDRAWELTVDGLQWIGLMDDDPPEPPKRGEKPAPQAHPEVGGGHDCVDLTEDIREAMIIGFSGYPLCKPECKGLCATCGTNLNKAACRCAPPDNSSWAILDRWGAQ